MKAMLLAAGLGTRLRPLTNNLPKCMLPVAGKPVLARNIEWLRDQGVVDIVVNLHYFPEAVTNYFGDGGDFGVRITYSHETELMGTAGAVWAARRFFAAEDRFLVLYADNLIRCDLARLYAQHLLHRAALTMALYWREDVSASGVVDLDSQGRIIGFKEKPRPGETESHLINAGLFLCRQRVVDWIPAGYSSDFGHNVLPAMLSAQERLWGHVMNASESLHWIDTLADLSRTNRHFEENSLP